MRWWCSAARTFTMQRRREHRTARASSVVQGGSGTRSKRARRPACDCPHAVVVQLVRPNSRLCVRLRHRLGAGTACADTSPNASDSTHHIKSRDRTPSRRASPALAQTGVGLSRGTLDVSEGSEQHPRPSEVHLCRATRPLTRSGLLTGQPEASRVRRRNSSQGGCEDWMRTSNPPVNCQPPRQERPEPECPPGRGQSRTGPPGSCQRRARGSRPTAGPSPRAGRGGGYGRSRASGYAAR